jgi:hypothetical protein
MEVRRRILLHLLLVAAVSAGLYAHTLDAPFQWDGKEFILKNPFITDPTLILEPSRAAGHEWYGTVLRRYVTYFSFWVNYRLHGTDPAGYHVFNITVHFMNSLLVCWLVVLLFRTPGLNESPLAARGGTVALASALLFAAHPVQTEAVTYIFQRHASLVGLFWLLSVCSYLRWRTGGRWSWYALALVSALLAMKTKENAFMLPLVIALAEVMFFSGGWRRRLLLFLPLLLVMMIIPFSLMGVDSQAQGMLSMLGEQAGLGRSVLKGEGTVYLMTQPRVLVTYLRLLIFPVNQNVDYDYPAADLTDLVFGILFHVMLMLFAAWLFMRALRGGRAELMLVGFGAAWFYFSLFVESGMIPIPMGICEYRMYVPSVGFMIGCVTILAFLLADRRRPFWVLVVLVVALFGIFSIQRNQIWRDEISLWNDAISKSPEKARPHYNMASAYTERGQRLNAVECGTSL